MSECADKGRAQNFEEHDLIGVQIDAENRKARQKLPAFPTEHGLVATKAEARIISSSVAHQNPRTIDRSAIRSRKL